MAQDGGRRIARWLASIGAFVAVAAAGIGVMFLFPEPTLSGHDFIALAIYTFGLGLLLYGLLVAAPFVLVFIVALAAAWWTWTRPRFRPPAHRASAVLRFAARADAEAARAALAAAGFASAIERSADPARTLLAVHQPFDPTPAALRKLQQRLDDIAHAHAGEHDASLLRIEPNR